jgi:hypothetical protein
MADEIVGVKVQVDTSEATANVKKLKKEVEGAGDSAESSAKDAKKAAGAFSSIGSTLKTLGVVSIVSKGFDFFKEVLGKNQKVADALSTTMNFLTGVFSDLVAFIVDNTDKVVAFFKDVFENPKKYIDDLAKAIKENLIERVRSVIDAFGFLGEIIKNVFTGNFDAAGEAAKKFGKEMVDVVTGVDDAFDKTSKALGDLVDQAGDYFGKKLDQAKALTKATNDAVIAEAKMLNAVKETEIAAERLRQKRDDENLSIKERIAANEELGNVLKKGQEQELALIGIRARKVQNEIALNGTNKELQAELIRLAGERKDVEEKYTAFASEQLVNRNALLREQRDIEKSVAENQNKILIDAKKANAELIRDEIERLEVKKLLLKEESDLELKRLQDNIDNTKEGTAARAEAEIAYAQKKSEIDIQLQAQEDQISLARKNRQTSELENLVNNQNLDFEFRQQQLDAELVLLQQSLDNKLISQVEYNQKYKELSDKRLQIDQEEVAAQQALQDKKNALVNAGLNILQASIGENEKLANVIFAIQKALEIGKIISSTGSAIAQVQAGVLAVPSILPPGIPNPAFGAAVALGIKKTIGLKIGAAAQIAEIAAASITKFKGSKGAAPSAGGAAASVSAAAPIAPPQPQASVTQLDQQSINQIGSATSRAYVLESDVTNSQERIRRINRAARLG